MFELYARYNGPAMTIIVCYHHRLVYCCYIRETLCTLIHISIKEKRKCMVLPEELVNYVKDQLAQEAPVANIISDVKSKGYQISSSTIYKIRATILPKRSEIQKQSHVSAEHINETVIPQLPQSISHGDHGVLPGNISLASVDIQESKILLKVYKNEHEIMSKSYVFNNTQEELDQAMSDINAMCRSILINHVVITSMYLNEQNNVITLPDHTKYQIESFESCKSIHTYNYYYLVGIRYCTLFNTNIMLLVLDDEFKCYKFDYKTLQQTQIYGQHLVLVKHDQDTRILKKICPYHDDCALNYLNINSISDEPYVYNYIAQILYILCLCHQDVFFVLTGQLLQKLNQAKLLSNVKHQLQLQLNNVIPNLIIDSILHVSQQDSGVLGGISILQKNIKPDGVLQINPLIPHNTMLQPYAPNPSLKIYKPHTNNNLNNSFASDRPTTVFSRIPTACDGFQPVNQTPMELEMLATAVTSTNIDTKLNE